MHVADLEMWCQQYNIEEFYEMRMRSYVTACCRVHFSLAVMFLFIQQLYVIFKDIEVPIYVLYYLYWLMLQCIFYIRRLVLEFIICRTISFIFIFYFMQLGNLYLFVSNFLIRLISPYVTMHFLRRVVLEFLLFHVNKLSENSTISSTNN
jgi:hypothetical protein